MLAGESQYLEVFSIVILLGNSYWSETFQATPEMLLTTSEKKAFYFILHEYHLDHLL